MAYAYEKRDFERLKSKTAVNLFFCPPPKSLEGVCIDISDKGLGIDLESIIAIGTECRIKVHDGQQNSQPYQALIEIKNTQALPKGRCRVDALILEMF